MKLKRIHIFLLLLLLQSLSGYSITKRVLFIGNSYTLNHDLPGLTADVTESAGDELIYGVSAYSSYSLQLHSSNATTLEMIRQGNWNHVVLQEYSLNPSESLSWVQSNVFPHVQFLNDEILSHNNEVETMFYMTWGRRDGDAGRCPYNPHVCTYEGMDDLTRERYLMMAEIFNGVVSPVGAVWRYLRENHPSIELYDPDGSHPTEAGTYAAACCFYTAIFQKDPALISYNYRLGSSTASIIRNAVKEVVYNRLPEWRLTQPAKHTIHASAGTGGMIDPSGTRLINPGQTVSFNIIPYNGYVINDVRVDNMSVGTPSTFTFHDVNKNHNINATFRPITRTIMATARSGGSISPEGNTEVNYGSTRTFTITPDRGYYINDVYVDDESVGALTSYTFSDIRSNHSITATFSRLRYSITANPGHGGSISPEGTTEYFYGSDITCQVKPATGYRIADVQIDNVSIGPVSTYTFSNLTSNHRISATFAILTYEINAEAGKGGTISPGKTTRVNYGSNQNYLITPGTGYRIADVKVDNKSVGPVNEYYFENITDNHSISAAFSIITYEIETSSNEGGRIVTGGSTVVNHGSSLHLEFIPEHGYRLKDVIVDNVSKGKTESYVFSDIITDHSVTVEFEPIPVYMLKAMSGNGGSVSPQGTTDVFEGSDFTYSITPDHGYRVKDVFVDNVMVGSLEEFTFSNITADHLITASFTTSSEVAIYPNPFTESFNIKIISPHGFDFDIEVTDLSGRLIYSLHDVPGNSITSVSLSEPGGIYLGRILLDGKRIHLFKILKSVK